MSSIKSRLRRLEQGSGGACPECGFSPETPGRIVHSDGEDLPNSPEELCPGCGRPLWFVIRVVEGDDEEEVNTYWLRR